MYPEEFSTELEWVYFDSDPVAHTRWGAFESFVDSLQINRCSEQLIATVEQLEQVLIQCNTVDGVLSEDPELTRAFKALSVFKLRIDGLPEPEACSFSDAENLLGRGKKLFEKLVNVLLDSDLSGETKTSIVLQLTQSLRKAAVRVFMAVLEATEQVMVYNHPLACLFYTTRRNLIDQTLSDCARTFFEQDQSLFYSKDHFSKGLRSALGYKYDLMDTGEPELPPLDASLVAQAEVSVRKAVSNSGVLVHLGCQLQDVLRLKLSELRLSNISRIPLSRRNEVLQFIEPTVVQLCADYNLKKFKPEHAVLPVDDAHFGMPVFNPALFECMQHSLLEENIGLDLHYPLIAERSASSAGLGKEQLLFAGNIIWVCLQSSTTQGQIERYHRNFGVDDLPWLLGVDLPSTRKVELLAVYLMQLNQSAHSIDDFAEAVYDYCQAQANVVDVLRGWFHLPPRYAFPWAQQLAIHALEGGCESMYHYFSSALSGWHIRKLMQQSIEQGDHLILLQNLSRFDPDRMRELVSATINGWWLAHASEKGRVKLIRLLVAFGANVDARCVAKRTPLIWATKFASVETVRVLFEQGANPLFSYKDGRDLCYYASTTAVDREAKFELVLQALREAALEPVFVEAALALGHEQKTKRSLLKDLDPRPCTGYVWARVSLALLYAKQISIFVHGMPYTALDAAEQAMMFDDQDPAALLAKMKCEALLLEPDRHEVLDLFCKAFEATRNMVGKKSSIGVRPQFSHLWAELADMPLWQDAPQLSVDESAQLTACTETSSGRVTRLDCLIHAIRNSPNTLDYHVGLAKGIQAFIQKKWFSQIDTEFVWSIAADALSKGISLLLNLGDAEHLALWKEYAKCFRGEESLMLDNGMVVSRESCLAGQVVQEVY